MNPGAKFRSVAVEWPQRGQRVAGVSLSTIKRYVKRRRAGEDLEPRRSTGRKRRILATPEEKRALWAEHDEATLDLQEHKMKKVRELIEGRDRHLVFLPSYSADFNPIDQTFSKIQGMLRKATARSFGALVEATADTRRRGSFRYEDRSK
jgi:transposase